MNNNNKKIFFIKVFPSFFGEIDENKKQNNTIYNASLFSIKDIEKYYLDDDTVYLDLDWKNHPIIGYLNLSKYVCVIGTIVIKEDCYLYNVMNNLEEYKYEIKKCYLLKNLNLLPNVLIDMIIEYILFGKLNSDVSNTLSQISVIYNYYRYY